MAAANESFDPVSTPGTDSPAKPSGHQQLGAIAAQHRELYQRFVEVVERDGRYPIDAYRFLQEALEFTVHRAFGQDRPPADEPDSRHVDGGQLCLGLRDLAVQRWGRLAQVVLNSWGIRTTNDLGEMVFLLVANEFLRKTEQDHREDFDNVFALGDLHKLYEVPQQPLVEPEFAYA